MGFDNGTNIGCYFPLIPPVYLCIWISNLIREYLQDFIWRVFVKKNKEERKKTQPMSSFPSDPNSLLLIKIREENTHGNILWQIWIQIIALPLLSFVILDKRQGFTSKEGSLTFEKIEFYVFPFLKDYCFSRRGYGRNTYRNA